MKSILLVGNGSLGNRYGCLKASEETRAEGEVEARLSPPHSDTGTVPSFLDGHSQLSSSLIPSLEPQQFLLLCDFSVAEIRGLPTLKPYILTPRLSKKHFILALRTFILQKDSIKVLYLWGTDMLGN